ncbi:MAG: glycosyltransferase family 2 protein [Gemmatimonadota bacterium]
MLSANRLMHLLAEEPLALDPVPLFSVVIPTYGRATFLNAALESVLAQTINDWECLVAVDGGEVPSTPSDPRIKVIRRVENGGPAAARNSALDHAIGKYIAFLDDDDTWLPDRLEIAASGLIRAPVATCFGISHGRLSWQGEWEGDVSDTLLEGKVPSLNCVAVRREVAVRFDERFRGGEDVDWLFRVAQIAEFTTVPRPGFVLGNAGTYRADAPQRLEGLLLFMEVHAEYLASHPRAAARRWSLYGNAAFRGGRRWDGRRAHFQALRHDPCWKNLQAWLCACLR